MKILFFILFASINLGLTLKTWDQTARIKHLKLLGLGIPVTFVIAILVMLAIRLMNIRPHDNLKGIFFSIVMSILTILLLNIMVITASYLIDHLVKFHQEQNASNVQRLPVSFLLKNQVIIKNVFKVLFFMGSLLMFYGLWIAKK